MAAQHSRTSRYAAALLLWLFFAQVALEARETSITLDEPLHIASGYACLLTGDYRLVEEHPPLLKMLQAAPLLLAQPPLQDPRTSSGWEGADLIAVAREIVIAYRPVDALVFAARVPTMLIGVLLGAVIYRWTADLTRRHAYAPPLLALLLYTFDPNMLAHGAVAATDLGAAAAIAAAVFAYWRWWRSARTPRLARALGAAVMLGMALGTKNTALLLGPVYAVVLWRGLPRGRATRAYLLQGALIAAGALLTLWAVYRFEVGTAAGVPFAVPAPSHLLPLAKLQQHMREGHSAFLLGQNYHHGDWRYFPVALALKTPPLTLALGMLCIATAAWARRRRAFAVTGLCLWLFPTLYFAVSLVSGINIGYRHLLPILPFLHVSIGAGLASGIRLPKAAGRIARGALFALLVGYVSVTFGLHPWHLAYFNVFAGGPDGGYRYLVDSNLDWGQTWKALRTYLDARGITEFYLSNYTINDPRAYGLDYTPLAPWPEAPPVMPQRYSPPPGVYAISSTQLQGVVVADPEMFDYFRKLEPAARIGHAMFVYDIAPRPAIEWVTQCTVPVAPLPAADVREGLGIGEDVPLIAFDCGQSWIVPPGSGRTVVALGQDLAWAPKQGSRLAYEQTRSGWVPPFAVYEALGGSGDLLPPVQAEPLTKVGHVLTFLGYAAPSLEAGTTAVLETWWRVEARPGEQLSLMVHLVDPDGTVIAVGDALGVTSDQWLPGSLLVQRHALAIPPVARPGPYALHAGAYTLPNVRRLEVTRADGSTGDFLIAGTVEVSPP